MKTSLSRLAADDRRRRPHAAPRGVIHIAGAESRSPRASRPPRRADGPCPDRLRRRSPSSSCPSSRLRRCRPPARRVPSRARSISALRRSPPALHRHRPRRHLPSVATRAGHHPDAAAVPARNRRAGCHAAAARGPDRVSLAAPARPAHPPVRAVPVGLTAGQGPAVPRRDRSRDGVRRPDRRGARRLRPGRRSPLRRRDRLGGRPVRLLPASRCEAALVDPADRRDHRRRQRLSEHLRPLSRRSS